MKFKIIVLSIILALFGLVMWLDVQTHGFGAETSTIPTDADTYELAPEIAFTTLDGREIPAFTSMKEPKVILNFWATWCTPCLVELPLLLEKVAQSDGEMALVAIAVDDGREAVEKFLARMRHQHGAALVDQPGVYWVWDERKRISLDAFGVLKVPETIVLDEKRRMIRKIVGEITPQTEL